MNLSSHFFMSIPFMGGTMWWQDDRNRTQDSWPLPLSLPHVCQMIVAWDPVLPPIEWDDTQAEEVCLLC